MVWNVHTIEIMNQFGWDFLEDDHTTPQHTTHTTFAGWSGYPERALSVLLLPLYASNLLDTLAYGIAVAHQCTMLMYDVVIQKYKQFASSITWRRVQPNAMTEAALKYV